MVFSGIFRVGNYYIIILQLERIRCIGIKVVKIGEKQRKWRFSGYYTCEMTSDKVGG